MQNRREFLKSSAMFSAMVAVAPSVVVGQGAPRTFKVGLIGCGGRGTGAVQNIMAAARQIGHAVTIVATHDFFLDKAQSAAKNHGCDEKFAFGGAEGYKKVMEGDCEIVILATPPAFRALHLEAAVKAGKHVFSEKPVAVDPPGIRQYLAAAAEAKTKKLAIVAGTQRRHQGNYIRQFKALQAGAVGRIVGGTVYWNMGALWVRDRRATDSNAAYLANNWVNWMEMSGDHIVEQHVHNLDVAAWFLGRAPKTATGFGGRMRRRTGNQYDFFSVDFDYGDAVHIHSMCRQISGCSDRVGETFRTTEAEILGGGKITRQDGKAVQFEEVGQGGDPYVNEHVDLLKGILSGEVLNEGENVAMSNAAAIMGRITAYTGRTVRMADLLEIKDSPFYNLTCKPAAIDFESGKDVELPPENVAPVPGK